MDGSLVAAMISLCLSASQVGGLCPLPGGWSKITPPAAATAYIRSQEAAQQAQARREQEAQEMAQKKAEEEAQKAAQEEAKKAEEAAQQADFDYEAIAASFPQTPLQTSSMVGQDDEKSWWFQRNETKTPPTAQNDICILDYDAYYLGDTSQKIIYLTFDEGYENGYTTQILDILKANDVQAAFFVTSSYITQQPELIKRMVAEGHVVGNHSDTHPNMSTLTEEQMAAEIENCNTAFRNLTGQDIDPFFRPPSGQYSIRSLQKTKEMGYKTIFWSLAYKDWDTSAQPGRDLAYQSTVNYVHNGAIVLLHAVSQSNTEALDDVLKTLKAEGYEFRSLYDLPECGPLLQALKQQREAQS